MNFLALLRLSVNSLRHHKSRSALTALGIIIGVTTVIAILSLLEGLNRSIDQEFSALGANTIYVQKMEFNIGGGRPRNFDEIAKRADLTLEDAAALARLPTIRAAVPTVEGDEQTLSRGVFEAEDCELAGIAEGGDLTGNWVISEGRYITAEDRQRRSMVCVIGSYVAENLFAEGEDPLGQTLTVDGRSYRVVGVLEEKGASFGRPQDNKVFVPISTYLKYYTIPEGRRSIFHGLEIEVLPHEDVPIETALEDVEEVLRLRRGLRYYEDNDFGLNTQTSMLSSLNTITSILWMVMVGVASISLIVGGIGIMNIMLVSVAERTREIGIRKAVGARDRDVLVQFLLESITLSAFGGVIGILLGLGVGEVVSMLSPLDAVVVWWTIILGFGFSASVGILFGIYPARKASRLNPIEAIRYE
jgi:putative ABC transport system permease protein